MLDRVKAQVHKRARSLSRLRDSFSSDHDKDVDIYGIQQHHKDVQRKEVAQNNESERSFLQHPAVRPLSNVPVPRSPTTSDQPPQFVSSPNSSLTKHRQSASTGSSSSSVYSQESNSNPNECWEPGKSKLLARPHLDHHHSCQVEPLRLSRDRIPLPKHQEHNAHLRNKISLDHQRDATNPNQLYYKLANLDIDDDPLSEQSYPRSLPPDTDSDVVEYRKYADVDFDHTVHEREAVTHETIKPHVHTIYEPKRTRSIHIHEHKEYIQPVIDPEPTILPAQHWAEDHRTGEVFKIPDELGRQLMEQQQQLQH